MPGYSYCLPDTIVELTSIVLFITVTVLVWVALIYSFSAFWWLVEVFPMGFGWESADVDAWRLDDI